MQITLYKDGSFEFNFTKEEAELGMQLLSLIMPADKESADYISRAVRTLAYLHTHGKLPSQDNGNIVPFNKKPH